LFLGLFALEASRPPAIIMQTSEHIDIAALQGGRTRLTIRAAHMLRIDPVIYWEPIARWAIRTNVRRVLVDAKIKAERSPAEPGNIQD
jgi:hypothetical protein